MKPEDPARGSDLPPPRPNYGATAADPWLPPAEVGPNPSIADTLEPGRLRDELGGRRVVPPRRVPARISHFAFTADGAEYFRIWAVNLLLTLVTLGVYSAWAKVRKTRYFWQNTRLDGHVFDYHGNPRAILVGRAIALVLLVAYTFAFDVSRTAGLVMVAVLCIVGPWMFMRAQRFKLANTSWRGLRFGFEANVAEAYRVTLPPLVIWFSSAIATALASDRLGILGAAGLVSAIMLPWMHHRLKAYSHDRARYGGRLFAFLRATPSFYAVYFKAGLIALFGGVLGMLAGIAMAAFASEGPAHAPTQTAFYISMATVALVTYLVAWPYFAARLQAVVWSHTRLDDIRFSTAIAAGPLFRLTLKNVLLTVATAGLYWPFAAVALARYRVECMRVESEGPLGVLADATVAGPGDASGDAALDTFGLDIGI